MKPMVCAIVLLSWPMQPVDKRSPSPKYSLGQLDKWLLNDQKSLSSRPALLYSLPRTRSVCVCVFLNTQRSLDHLRHHFLDSIHFCGRELFHWPGTLTSSLGSHNLPVSTSHPTTHGSLPEFWANSGKPCVD